MDTTPALPEKNRDRRMSYLLFAIGCGVLVFASLIGISDNPPGIVAMFAGFFAIVLGIVFHFGHSGKLKPAHQMLYWAPRALCIAFAVFISLFALDVFNEGKGLWGTVLALLMHLVPTFLIIILLLVSWRREWIAGILFLLMAVLYIVWAWHKPFAVWWSLLLMIGPLVLTAALFLVNWHYREQLRGQS